MNKNNYKSEFLEVFSEDALKKLPLNLRMIRKIYESNSEEILKNKVINCDLVFERVSSFHQTNCYSVKVFYKPVSNLI